MFGSEVLDVAIGLILVFMLTSIVLTAVQEVLESWFKSRAADLNSAIYELLQRNDEFVENLYKHPLVFALHRGGIAGRFNHSEIASPTGWKSWSLFGADWQNVRKLRGELPSYIPRETFAAALLDLLKTQKESMKEPGPSDLGKIDSIVRAYDALNRLSGGDLGRVRTEIEGWYDGAMDRASGWFKRRTQKTLFWLGLSCAVALNLNAITIARYLATDEQARHYVTRYAEQITGPDKPPPGTPELESLHKALQEEVGLPIGWSDANLQRNAPNLKFSSNWQAGATLQGLIWFITLLLGYLITAFAAMLGAPFWFDVLNRVMVIRSTVKPKEKSPDEPSEDGGVDAIRRKVAAADTPQAGPAQSSAAAGPAIPASNLLADAEDEEDLDGCLSGHELEDDDVTDDVELPPTAGGVATC